MTGSLVILIFLTLAFVFAAVACASRTAERFLWGSVICSLGLGLAVQVSGGSYYGLTMVAVFLVTDIVVYLYFRTQRLLPAGPPKNPRSDRLFRVFFLWLAACFVAAAGFVLFRSEPFLPARALDGPGLRFLHERIWASDWLLLLISFISLLGLVTGGFFLVRREP